MTREETVSAVVASTMSAAMQAHIASVDAIQVMNGLLAELKESQGKVKELDEEVSRLKAALESAGVSPGAV